MAFTVRIPSSLEKAAHETFAFQSESLLAPQGLIALLTRGAATGLN